MPRADRTELRVRYPETDRMGVVHHTHFLVWFEMGRTELMRRAGVPYGTLESEGLFFPVVEASARYLAPARYDEVVEVRTTLSRVGGARVRFDYRVLRPGETDPLATGYTVHASVGRNGRPVRIPPRVLRCLEAP